MKFRIKLLVALSFLWAATASAFPKFAERTENSIAALCSPASGAAGDLAKVCTDKSDGAYGSNGDGILVFIGKDGHQCSLAVTNIDVDPWHLDETSGVASSDLRASSGEILSVNFRYMPVGWGYDLLGISFRASLSADTFTREMLIGFSDIKPCETIQEAGLK